MSNDVGNKIDNNEVIIRAVCVWMIDNLRGEMLRTVVAEHKLDDSMVSNLALGVYEEFVLRRATRDKELATLLARLCSTSNRRCRELVQLSALREAITRLNATHLVVQKQPSQLGASVRR